MNVDYQKVSNALESTKEEIYLDSNSNNAKTRFVRRGQVYNCYYGFGVGSEIEKERPVVIISNHICNIKSSNVVVLPITHTEKSLPTFVSINPKFNLSGEVILDGFVNASNISCVSKARLKDYIANLSDSEMKQVDKALAISVDLMRYYSELSERIEAKEETIRKLINNKNESIVDDVIDNKKD